MSQISLFLGRADKFSHFVLFSTFVFFLDGTLVYYKGMSILSLDWGYVSSKLKVGEVLVFFCMFSLFMTFVVGFLKNALTIIGLILPDWLRFDQYEELTRRRGDYKTTSQMVNFAIDEDNSIAYNVAIKKIEELESGRAFERHCFAFVLVSLISFFIGSSDVASLVRKIFTFKPNQDVFSIEMVKSILVLSLYMTTFYIGVLKGCGFIDKSNYSERIYHPNKEPQIKP